MKKFLLILSLILTIHTASFATFSDVKNYSDEIDYLSSKGVITGYEDGTFKPSEKITRAEFAKMIVMATETSKEKESEFLDVASNHWAKKYIDIAVAANFMKGDSENTFRPEDNITYGEACTVLVRASGKEKEALKIDLNWPLNYMKEAENLKLFDGYITNDLVAGGEARRDSIALMVYNMLKPSKAEQKNETDTTTAFAGIVTEKVEKRGEIFVKVVDSKDNEVELKLYKESKEPQIGSFLIYQLTTNNTMKIRKETKVEDFESSYLLVTAVDEVLVSIKDKKVLDLSLDKYNLDGKDIKLNKCNFFVISMEDGEFSSYEIYKKEDVKFKKNYKIKFDDTLNVCYVIVED